MAKFNTPATHAAVHSPIRTEPVPTGVTFEGAPGFARDAKSELFLLAVTNMVGERTFHEPADSRDSRFAELIREVALDDREWTVRFLAWLRNSANMRSASLVGAAEAVKALIGNPDVYQTRRLDLDDEYGAEVVPSTPRQIVRSVLKRADEPGEFLAYWHSRFGRNEPKAVKRGIADAIVLDGLWDQYELLKYDTVAHPYRFADVIERVHPTGVHRRVKGSVLGDLFEYALDRRHGNDDTIPATMDLVQRTANLRRVAADAPDVLLDPAAVRESGLTWEDALSLAGNRVDKARLWEALIPSMGYMALLRNLKGFDEAGVSDTVAATVAAKLADPAEVARSRQLPMRFLSAYRAAPSLRWSWPLEQALDASLTTIPELPGRTLILVDTSTSMNAGFSRDGTLMRWDAAALFGLALGRRCANADVVSFSSNQSYYGDAPGPKTKPFELARGGSVLADVTKWKEGGWFLGGGTDTAGAVRRHYAGHDRVVILTDEQAARHDDQEVTAAVPQNRMVYTWNLAGYERGHAPSGPGTRHTFGGLNDAAFAMIGLLEAGQNARWPF